MRNRTTPAAEDLAATQPWRRSQLRHAGFDARLAAEIAADPGYDLHAILDLTRRGCPPHLAARIVAPLTDERP